MLLQLRVEACIEAFNKLITFIGRIEPAYYSLIKARDARALLIMSYWIAQMCHVPLWWIRSRAVSERTAIVTFLAEHPDARVRELLDFPRSVLGVGDVVWIQGHFI